MSRGLATCAAGTELGRIGMGRKHMGWVVAERGTREPFRRKSRSVSEAGQTMHLGALPSESPEHCALTESWRCTTL